MASLQITVFPDATIVPLGDPVLEEKITIGAVSAPSTVLPGAKINYRVRIFAEVNCYVTWGASTPVAKIDGSEGRMIGAENPEFISVAAGEKIAVIERV